MVDVLSFETSMRPLLLSLWLLAANAAGQSSDQTEQNPQARFVTNQGEFVIELFPRAAPKTVENFVTLVDDGFYDGLIFHRVIANFVIQTGGYDEAMVRHEAPRQVPNESTNGLRNRKGSVAMARLADPDSAGSQFFINVRNNASLDATRGKAGYTVFGRVVTGWDVVERIELSNTIRKNGLAGVPETPIVIQAVQIIPETVDAPESNNANRAVPTSGEQQGE